MATVRLLSHGSGKGPSTTQGSGKPSNQAGGLLDLPVNSNDVNTFEANGWTRVALVGTTAQRPTGIGAGTKYADTTLTKLIQFDGISWRDVFSGSVV